MRQLCRFSIVAVLVVLSGCASQPPKANTTHPDVAHIGAVTYHVRDSGDATPDEHPSGIGVSRPPSCTKWGTDTGELFHGCARRAAKVSLVPLQDAAAERYQTVVDLKQNLIDDDTMRHHTPPITEAADSEREYDEQRNVVLDAVVYAFKAEDDRDFHLIVGDPGCDNSKCFMNVEVSALPKDAGSDKDDLTAVRAEFRSWLEAEPGATYLFFVDDQGNGSPVPVRIEGSLFYDLDHVAGTVGPTGFRPDTSWEIHPIRKLAQR